VRRAIRFASVFLARGKRARELVEARKDSSLSLKHRKKACSVLKVGARRRRGRKGLVFDDAFSFLACENEPRTEPTPTQRSHLLAD